MKLFLSSLFLILVPQILFAAAFTINTFADLVYGTINNILRPVGSLLIALSVLWFIYNGFKFIQAMGDKERNKYRDGMIYGDRKSVV